MAVGTFENDVKTYGTQAIGLNGNVLAVFENDVKTYGTQAEKLKSTFDVRLRMM